MIWQVFVVCPMIEENEELPPNMKSAQEHAAELQRYFPDLKVACVHGKLPHYDELDVKTRTVLAINGLDNVKGLEK